MQVEMVNISPELLDHVAAHSHPNWEIILHLVGKGHSIVGDKIYPFEPGTIICLPPFVPHAKVSDEKIKDIYIEVRHFIPPNPREAVNVFRDEDNSFRTLMFLALRIFHKQGAGSRHTVNALFEAMYSLMQGLSRQQPANRHVALVKNMLVENFSNPEFEVTQALNQTHYCKDYLRRCFLQETGMTPMAYLTHLRLSHARRLLSRSADIRLPISQIALFSGFYDAHYFSRLFKKHTGLTPRAYAARLEKEPADEPAGC